ncbi:hypothetical protein B0H19DRAFT_1095030 [Mycena capillaripes]|nr:hypothetical protein B0H19DRAFT_1095030 [Mycena capillaripes]
MPMDSPTAAMNTTSTAAAAGRPPRLRRRRMSAPAPRAAPPRLPPCRPLPLSLEALDLSPASPAQALASLRFLVLSYLADLERRLSLFESAEWASTALDMLHAIRADVRSHLPDLPSLSLDFDFEFDFDFDLGARLPDVKGLVASIDFSRPLSYVPTLSARLRSLHAHLADEFPSLHEFEFRRPSFDFHLRRPSFDFDFSTPPVLSELLDAFRADVDAFLAELPNFPSLPTLPSLPSSLSLPAALSRSPSTAAAALPAACAYPTVEEALTKSEWGRRLIGYNDLPLDWRNNEWVVTGYRFIPLTPSHWPRLPLSLLQLHNESLNIHTHFIPLVLWGAAYWGVEWMKWMGAEWVGEWVEGFARYTPFAGAPARRAPPPDESLFTFFALACLASSTLWHTMAGCAHKKGMETCARVDYVGIGWLIATSIATVVHHGYACAEQAVDATPLGHTILHPTTLLHTTGAGVLLQSGKEMILQSGKEVLQSGKEMLSDEMGHAMEVVKEVGNVLLHPGTLLHGAAPEVVDKAVVGAGGEGMGLGWALSFVFPFAGPVCVFARALAGAATSLSSSVAGSASALTSALAPLAPLASWPAYHPVGAACLLLCAAAGVSGNVLPFCDWFNRVENRLWRLAFFVGISFSALAPLAGIATLQGWDVMLRFIAPIGPSLLYYIIGLVIYATQVPECFIGGRGGWVSKVVDMCGGGSHAIWHVFIVLAIRAHRDGLREMRKAAVEGGCAAGVKY